jgi:hypothetical protein
MKKLLILFAAILITIPLLSQERSKFLYAEFADKSVTLYPFYKPFGYNFDPAVTVGAGLEYKQKGNFTLFQTAQITGYKTPFIGRGMTLTSSFGYSYGKSTGFFGEAMIGLGATAFFPSRETFTQDENNVYTHSTPLHVNAAVPVDLVLGYAAGTVSFYLKYRYMVIGPYTEVMPVVPNALIGLGIRYHL